MVGRFFSFLILLATLLFPAVADAEPTLIIAPPHDPCQNIADLATGKNLRVGGVNLSMSTFSYASCEYAREQVEASVRARLASLRAGVEERGKAELDAIYDRFLTWLAGQVREVVYQNLSEEQRRALSPEAHFKAWLQDPDQELSAYVNYYFGTHFAEFQPYLERYQNDNSREIVGGLSDLWTKAKQRLEKLTGAVRKLDAEPEATPERVAEILEEFGLSGPWITRFRKYENRFNSLDRDYDIVNTARMIHAAFTAEDYSGRLTGMFALMEKFGGYLSDSNVPGVSLLGTLIEAYGQIAKEALVQANKLEKLIRQREGHCIGLATHTLLEKRSLAFKAMAGDDRQACPLDQQDPFLRDIYVQSIPQDEGQLYFWNGAGFIKGRSGGGGRSGVEAAQSFIRGAAAIGLVEYVGKDTDMAMIAAVYNTPYGPKHYLKGLPGHSHHPGLPGINAEGQAVIRAITTRIKALRDGAWLNADCSENDYAAFLDRETGLLLSRYPLDDPELLSRLAFSYALGFVQKHNAGKGGSVGRAGIYDRYKRIWQRLSDLSLLVVDGRVVDKRGRDRQCSECEGAQITISMSGGNEWPGCGVTAADASGRFMARIGTRSAEVSVAVSASAGEVTSEKLTINQWMTELSKSDIPFVRTFSLDVPLPLEGDEDTAETALNVLRGLHGEALEAASTGAAACSSAKSAIAELAAARAELAARAEQIASRLKQLAPKRSEFDRSRNKLEAAMQSAEKSAEAVVKAKSEAESAALSACELTSKLRKEKDEALQRRMLTEVRGHVLAADRQAKEAHRTLETTTQAALQSEEVAGTAVEIAEALERVGSDTTKLLADAGGLKDGPPGLDGYKNTLSESRRELDRIVPLAKAAFASLKAAIGGDPEMADTLAEGKRLFDQIDAFPAQIKKCDGEIEKALSELGDKKDELQTAIDAIAKETGGEGGDGLAQLLAAQAEEARASADVAEIFDEAAGAAAIDARRCLKLAESALTKGAGDDLAAAVEAAIAQCKFKAAKTLLSRMKDSASYPSLSTAYQSALERERRTKALFDRAKALHTGGKPAEAVKLLNQARANTKCSSFQSRIDQAIAAVRGAGDDTLLAETRATIIACNFAVAKKKVAELGSIGHPSFAEAQADYQNAVEREQRTKTLFDQARSLHSEGKSEDAIGLLRQALANTQCDAYRTRINTVLAGLADAGSPDQQAGEPAEPGDAMTGWPDSFKGEVRLTRVIVNGRETTPLGLIQLIDREWRAYRVTKPGRDGVIPAIGDSLYDVITGAVIAVIGTLAEGVPLSFALKPEGPAYRFALVGKGETADPEKLKSVPTFQPVDERTLRMTWQDEEGKGRVTATFSADKGYSEFALDFQLTGRISGDDANQFYRINSLAATVSGRFEQGAIPAAQVEAEIKRRVKAAASRYAPYLKID